MDGADERPTPSAVSRVSETAQPQATSAESRVPGNWADEKLSVVITCIALVKHRGLKGKGDCFALTVPIGNRHANPGESRTIETLYLKG